MAGAGRGRRVLVVCHEHHLGGATTSVLRLEPRLRERGWECIWWCPRPSSLYEDLTEEGHEVYGARRTVEGFSLSALGIPPGARARLAALPPYLRELDRVVAAVRPDLVHANSMYTLLEAATARRRRLPVLCHVHEMIRPGPKGSIARRAIRGIAHHVVGVSAACVEAIGPGPGVGLVREGVEASRFAALAPSYETLPLRVGTIGVVSRRKGSDTFAEAAALIGERELPARFELVGSPTAPLDEQFARALIGRLEAMGVVHTPRVDPIEQALARWDAFVMPSREDPFPIATLEAMAAGLPIVGTRADGILEQLGGGAGILVEPGNPPALADAVARLIDDPGLRQRLGVAARRRVRDRFTIESQLEALLDAYERTLLAAR